MRRKSDHATDDVVFLFSLPKDIYIKSRFELFIFMIIVDDMICSYIQDFDYLVRNLYRYDLYPYSFY